MKPCLRISLVFLLAFEAFGQTVNYRGRVLEKAGMLPVPGALIKAGNLTALSGADGRFVLSGNVSGIIPKRTEMTPFLKGGNLLEVEAVRKGQPRLEWYAASGKLLASRKVTPPAAAAKSAAAEITISMDKLLPKTMTPTAADADVGDVVLEYPPRRLGLGAAPIYGADILFPKGGDSAEARKVFEALWIHKANSWRTSHGLGTTPLLWKVMQEPIVPASAPFSATLAPCCEPRDGSQGWGYDDIITKKTYGDFQLHLEFNMMGLPNGNSDSSGYCNSGIYLKGNLEVQIETPKANPSTYEKMHGMATLIDTRLPDKNMYPGGGKWQSYDITIRASRSDSPAKVTVIWNGEVVHNNQSWQGAGASSKVGFALQNELGSDVRFRNVWIKELDIKDAQSDIGY